MAEIGGIYGAVKSIKSFWDGIGGAPKVKDGEKSSEKPAEPQAPKQPEGGTSYFNKKKNESARKQLDEADNY